MKIAISYFYQVRHFKPYMIPLSTAVYDPKWYHNFQGHQHVFVDKNGVINGLRINPLKPPSSCDGLCTGVVNCSVRDSSRCEFIKKYREHLDSLVFEEFISLLNDHMVKVQKMLKFIEDPLAVILVHEKYDNPCSERVPLIQWFADNGLPVGELLYPICKYY